MSSDSNNNDNNNNQTQQLIKLGQNDLISLQRVSNKLTYIDNTIKLYQVLDKLLPRLLIRVGLNQTKTQQIQHDQQHDQSQLLSIYNQIHNKLLEILSHILKRVRDDIQCLLPCLDIIKSFFIIVDNTTTITKSPAEAAASSTSAESSVSVSEATATTTDNIGAEKHNQQEGDNDNNGMISEQQQGDNNNDDIVITPQYILNTHSIDSYTMNLSILFLTIGIPRCTFQQLIELLPFLLLCQTHSSVVQQQQQDQQIDDKDASSTNDNNTNTIPSLNYNTMKTQGYQLSYLLLKCIDLLMTDHQHHMKHNMNQPTLIRNNNQTVITSIPSSTADTKTTTTAKEHYDIIHKIIIQCRTICRTQINVSNAVYDLFLDVLLYQLPQNSSNIATTNSSMIPPLGLSQYGHERFLVSRSSDSSTGTGTASSSSTSWVNEMLSIRIKLIQLKISILHFISPNKKWGIFLSSNDNATNGNYEPMGIVQTIALLVIAAGDEISYEISDKASTSLKYHLDSYRTHHQNINNKNSSTNNNTTTMTTATSVDTTSQQNNPLPSSQYSIGSISSATLAAASALGSDAMVPLATGLLALCFGQTNAESILLSSSSSSSINTSSSKMSSLKTNDSNSSTIVTPYMFFTLSRIMDNTTTTSQQKQILLSMKRRPVSEGIITSIMTFISTKMLDDHPRLLEYHYMMMQKTIDGNVDDETTELIQPHNNNDNIVISFVMLAIQVTNKSLLISKNTSSVSIGLSLLRAKPYIASSQLLNSLSIRLSIYYDNNKFIVMNTTNIELMEHLLGQILYISCIVLTPVTTTMNSNNSNSNYIADDGGSITIRDNCYGIICTLSRSQFALISSGYIFCRGISSSSSHNNNSSSTDTTGDKNNIVLSVETAQLLFLCAANEIERLRPRAVAALDALLSAYHRAYCSDQWEMKNEDDSSPSVIPSPSSAIVKNKIGADHDKLANLLLPILWNAGQSYRLKSSRVASANWGSKLLKQFDIISSCHLLCFLSGDTDPTVATIAKNGLGISSKHSSSSSISSSSNSTTNDDLIIVTDDYDIVFNNHHNNIQLPNFSQFVKIMFSSYNSSTTQKTQLNHQFHIYHDFPMTGKATTLHFTMLRLISSLKDGVGTNDDDIETIGLYISALQQTLLMFTNKTNPSSIHGPASSDLLDECAFCLLVLVSKFPYARKRMMLDHDKNGSSDSFDFNAMKYLCLHCNSSKARRYLSSACYCLFRDMNLWIDHSKKTTSDDEIINVDITEDLMVSSWIINSKIDHAMNECIEFFDEASKRTIGIGNFHGCIFLSSQIIKAFRIQVSLLSSSTTIIQSDGIDSCWKLVNKIILNLANHLMDSDEIIGNACADGLAIAFSSQTMNAPVLDTQLYDSVSIVLSKLTLALAKFGHGDAMNSSRITKLAHATGICLSSVRMISSSPVNEENDDIGKFHVAKQQCVDALFDLLGSSSYRKEEELAITVGEAVATYSDSTSITTSINEMNTVYHVDDWPKEYNTDFNKVLPPTEQVLYTLLRMCFTANSPHKKAACAPALLAVVSYGTRKLHADNSYIDREFVKSLLRHIQEIQTVFISLLSYPKSKQLSRESCCLGLAACRSLIMSKGYSETNCDPDNHQRLLRAFGQSTVYGGSAMIETEGQAAARRAAESTASTGGSTIMEQFGEESEVGGTAGLGEAALGAYREMAATSVALGREDILYSLLVLSVAHTYWSSSGVRDKYCASSLLGKKDDSLNSKTSDAVELRDALRPHLGKLIPRILRACHDPNKQTREQMNSLWVGLTGGGAMGRLAITKNFITTIDALLDDGVHKLWRARSGAVGALSDIIIGRDWNTLGGGDAILDDDDMYDDSIRSAGTRLLKLWRVAMRALDDVRGAVREKGETLARAVKALTIRLCDPLAVDDNIGMKRRHEALQMEVEATAASITSLRWLIKFGLHQTCAEAAGCSISTLIEIVGVVRPQILEPSLPELLRSLLLAISGLEPAALNYVQLRASDQEGIERIRLQLAQSGPIALAITKCLELLPYVSLDTQKKVAPELDSALRLSSGFASRVAVADAVSSVCSTCPSVFRFPAASSANPAVRLLRALYFASERERGAVLSVDKIVFALGNLAALCPASSVRSLALRACDRYRSCTGGNDDPASRRTAAASLRSIAVRASNQFADGGKNDIWGRRVLPAAYVGRKDEDAKIAKLWNEVWEEGGSAAILASDTSSTRYGTTLEENLLPSIINECILALEDVSWVRRVAGASALSDLCALGVLAPTSTTLLSMNLPLQKEKSRNRAQSCQKAIKACLLLLAKPRIWNGKSTVMATMSKFAAKWVISDDGDEKTLLGWDGQGNCPWRPLIVAPCCHKDDLFVADLWFVRESQITVIESEPDTKAGEKMEQEVLHEDGKIDFDEIEKAIDAEDPVDDAPTLANVGSKEIGSILTFSGLCRFLIGQAFPGEEKSLNMVSDELLPYRTQTLKTLSELLNVLSENNTAQRVEVFDFIFPKFNEIFVEGNDLQAQKMPPVLVAGALNCLGACFWNDIGSSAVLHSKINAQELLNLIKNIGGKNQVAWTVRESSSLCMSVFAAKCHFEVLRQPICVSTMIQAASSSMTDPKFWRVRFAGLKVIECLTSRCGTRLDTTMTKQLILESLLPHKEIIIKLARKMLADSEASITALSSVIIKEIAWWP